MSVKSPFSPVPVSNLLLHEKLLSALDRHSKLHPHKAAMINAENPEERVTFAELKQQALSVASFLHNHGLRYGDVVCQVLPNSIEYAVGVLATLCNGAALSGASAMFTEYELERQFLDCKCKVVITNEENLQKVQDAIANCPMVTVILCVNAESHPPKKVFAWDEALDTTPTSIPAFPKNADDVAIIQYSSGTTGAPKGVLLSHKNVGTMVDLILTHLETYAFPKFKRDQPWSWYEQNSFIFLPFYHNFGFGTLMMTLLSGSTGIVMSHFDPALFLSTIQKYRIEVLMLVPPLLLMMCRFPGVEEYDLSSVRLVFTGAAPLSRELCDEFYGKFRNVEVIAQGYGMTECCMASHLPLFERENYGTVGYVASTFEQKIIEPETGATLPRGLRGEICVRGPSVMKGYLNRPEATAETIDHEGWLHTGDMGYIDEKGQTFIVDRIKELIKVKGLQVPPAELEDLLHGHPDIADVAVIGIPDERTGEKPKAFVVKARDELTEADVQRYVKEKLSSYKWLTGGVEFVDEIPKSPSGKILRRMLRNPDSKL